MKVTTIDSVGEIVAVLEVPDEGAAALNTPQGCVFVVGVPPDEHAYYDSDAGWVTKPQSPASFFRWDPMIKEWVDARDLAQAKAQKNAEINAARLAANEVFEHGGKSFAADPLSWKDISGTQGYVADTGSLPPGWPGAWKATDNTYLVIDSVAAWRAFYGSAVARGASNFFHSESLKTALAAATTNAEVDAIQW